MLITALPPSCNARFCNAISAEKNAHSQAVSSDFPNPLVFLLVEMFFKVSSIAGSSPPAKNSCTLLFRCPCAKPLVIDSCNGKFRTVSRAKDGVALNKTYRVNTVAAGKVFFFMVFPLYQWNRLFRKQLLPLNKEQNERVYLGTAFLQLRKKQFLWPNQQVGISPVNREGLCRFGFSVWFIS